MKIRGCTLLAASLLLGASSVGLAAGKKAAEPPPAAFTALLLLVPLAFLIVWLVVFTRKSGAMKQGGYMARASEHLDQSVEYMKRMEQKTDRMIQLLESIDEQLHNGD